MDSQEIIPVIYIPGFLSPRDSNQKQFEQVPLRKYYALEMMNHFVDLAEGRKYEDMSYDSMAQHVIQFADSKGLNKFSVAGYCFGGRVVSLVASKYPERVQDVILIETSFGSFQYTLLDQILQHTKYCVDNRLTKTQVEEYLEIHKEEYPILVSQWINYLLDKTTPEDKPAKWRVHLDIILSSYESKLQTLMPDFQYQGKVKIILGENTKMAYSLDDFKKVFPNMNLDRDIHIIKGTGHSLGLEDPNALIDAINQFYNEQQETNS